MAAVSEGYSIEIIDHCRVSPPPNSLPSSSLPLTFFDIPWLFLLEESSQLKYLVFYELPHSTSSFKENFLPVVKNSLSQALQKYCPMAAKLVVPPIPGTPQIVYSDGDSVSFTAVETMASFDELASDKPKDVKLLDPLVPKLSPWSVSEDGTCNVVPDLFSMQITLFPNKGIILGFQIHHAVCDGGSSLAFLRSLALMFVTGKLRSPPYLSREVIDDPDDLRTTFFKEWSEAFSLGPKHTSPITSYAGLKATFHLSKEKVKLLKDWISNRSVELGQEQMNITSFSAVGAYIWVCLMKSKEGDHENSSSTNVQRCHFGFTADCRSRVNIPENYFGNCLAPCLVSVDKKLLFGQHGIAFAAMAIAESAKRLENDGTMKEMKSWCSGVRVYSFEPNVTVAGFTRMKAYEKSGIMGFPRKFEMVHINSTGAISLVEGKEEGSVEIGIALEKVAMEKFTTLFEGLDSFTV